MRSHGRIVLASESLFFIDIDCMMSVGDDVNIFAISFQTDSATVMNGVDVFFAFHVGEIHHYGGVADIVDQHQFWGPGICNQHVDMSLELESLILRNSGQEIQHPHQWTSEQMSFGPLFSQRLWSHFQLSEIHYKSFS